MNDDALDREIREAVEPDPAAVARVVRGALDHERGLGRFSRSMSLVTAALAVLIVATVLLKTHDMGEDGAGPPHAPGVTLMTNVNDTVVLRPTSGSVWLVGGGQKSSQIPPGTIVVHSPGDVR
jgi:hypothetical protein